MYIQVLYNNSLVIKITLDGLDDDVCCNRLCDMSSCKHRSMHVKVLHLLFPELFLMVNMCYTLSI